MHLRSGLHYSCRQFYCCDCDRDFDSQMALKQHLRDKTHQPDLEQQETSGLQIPCTQFRCCDCDRDFVSHKALVKHLQDKIHRPKIEQQEKKNPLKEFPCDLCSKSFSSDSAVAQHKASQIHKPVCRPLQCIGSDECKKRFRSPSAMINHLESGACVSGLTRDKINEMIHLQDTDGLITSQKTVESGTTSPQSNLSIEDDWIVVQQLLGKPSAFPHTESRECFWFSADPSDTDTSESITTSGIMTPQSEDWSVISPIPLASWFLCPLCPSTSNRFRTAEDLEKHSKSPAHSLKIFHCPVALFDVLKEKVTKRKAFSTLSGLVMHIENGACVKGKKSFRIVLQFVNEMLGDLGLREIAF